MDILDKKRDRPAVCSFSRKKEKAICRLSKDRNFDAIDRTGKSRFVLPIVKDLSKESIKLSLVVLGNGNALDVSAYPEMDILELTPENLRFGKRLPDKNAVRKFIGFNTGVLCDLSLVERLPFLYLMSISMARMKIGLQKVSLNPYDFMIRTSEDITARDLLEKILFYWRSIDIKDNNL